MLELQENTKSMRLPPLVFTPNPMLELQTEEKEDEAHNCGESLLDQIRTPCDLKQLRIHQLPILAAEIRQLIIETVSKTGGHLASNLGTVELAIALHYVFDTPADKLIWDVGHQAYTHKILTARKDRFGTLRQIGGISGFPKPAESRYDVFGAGHSSTSVSAACGVLEACRLNGNRNRVVAVIGDGALMSGMAFEGLNNAGALQRDLIVILNDNQMSISANVGALSSYLARLAAGDADHPYSEKLRLIPDELQSRSDPDRSTVDKAVEPISSISDPGGIFADLGFRYFGPCAGHHIEHLVKHLQKIKKMGGPVMLHVLTKKGQGYPPAEARPTRFHGVEAFDPPSGKPAKTNSKRSYTAVFGDALTRIAVRDSRVVAITAGMATGTGLDVFRRELPDRFYDVGIAEPHAVTFAAGMAAEGLRPVVAIYSTFLQRAYDQVLHDVCLQNLPVVFMLDRAGLVGEDGPTHHGLFDLSYLRSMPNLILMAPKDENELQHMLYTAIRLSRPVAIRYPRGAGEGVALDRQLCEIPVGKAEIVLPGNDVAIIGIGSMVSTASEAAARLSAEGLNCGAVNGRFIKPIDDETIRQLAQQCRLIVTIEENVLPGGFGCAVLESLQHSRQNVRIHCMGVPDAFVEHGPQKLLRRKMGLSRENVVKTVKQLSRFL